MGRVKLLTIEQAPLFLRGNPYILTGYRAYLDTRLCLISLCVLSNEWVNIWTHLAGAIVSLGVLWHDLTVFYPAVALQHPERGSGDAITATFYLLCILFCMLMSGLYHLFNCQSHSAFSKWLHRDLFGVSVGIMACYVPGVFYAFECFPAERQAYTVVSLLLFAFAVVMQNMPQFPTAAWNYHRIAVYGMILGFGIIPCSHWYMLHLSDDVEPRIFLPRVAVAYCFAIVGVLFYMTKFPEVLFPGWFDYACQSHNFWHVFVMCGFAWWYVSGKEMLAHRLEHPCAVTPPPS